MKGKWRDRQICKSADLAIWDRNPYAIPTREIKEMKCQMTLYKGKTVFEAAH